MSAVADLEKDMLYLSLGNALRDGLEALGGVPPDLVTRAVDLSGDDLDGMPGAKYGVAFVVIDPAEADQ